jgi:predicted ABC-type transport system involved in lysophospholipase L1 biosynthesis ATPase subunit
MPALIGGVTRDEARRRALELLDLVGLADRADHLPSKMSGGEQQRVALARALMNNPAVVLADEPTGNLDVDTGKRVADLLWDATQGQGKSLVIVTHEQTIAARADRILRLEKGTLRAVKKEDWK